MEKELEKLNLDLQSKVELWLTYRKAKPASLISIRLEGEDENIKIYSKDIKSLKKWLNKANLNFLQDTKSPELFYVSRDPKKVEKLSKIMWKDDEQNTYQKGIFFGYPKEAVKVYAANIEACIKREKTFKEVGLSSWQDKEIKKFDKYWKWYMRYTPRRDYLLQDSMVAKKWADICRSEIPNMAKKFESELEKAK